MDPIRYQIDSENRIVFLNSAWAPFAEANSAPKLKNPNVIGQSIWKFISGLETRSLFLQIFRRVRATRKPIRIPYRCDGPTCRRSLELVISNAHTDDENALDVSSTEVQETQRDYVRLLDSNAGTNPDEALYCCSICKLFSRDGETWEEAEDIAMSESFFVTHQIPRLLQRVCPACAQVVEGCRYILSESTEESGTISSVGPFPLVLFLHGGGQSQFLLRLESPLRAARKRNLPPGTLILSPVHREHGSWNIEELESILREVESLYPIDPNRRFGTGVSLGATGLLLLTSRLSMRNPHYFKKLIPISGSGLRENESYKLRDVPLRAFHNARDSVVPYHSSKKMVDHLRDLGGDAEMTLYRDSSTHDAWSRTYSNPEVWNWMFH